MNTRKIWFRAKANSNNGSTHWFTIYQGRSVVIEAVISGKKRRGTASLPQLICFRCKPGVKSETDVFHALQTRFKVKGIKKFGG